MKIVKLDAIDSTNTYLKEWARRERLENWTIVQAISQTNGKGQRQNKWHSEAGKNLTFSVFVNFNCLKAGFQHYLNYTVSIAIFEVLKFYIPQRLAVKWPNDILSANAKIGGILIECNLKENKVNEAIIGIGLNVNQTDFSSLNTLATSIKKINHKVVDLEELLQKIVLELQYQMLYIQQHQWTKIKNAYEAVLYKFGIPSTFIAADGTAFLGIIRGTTDTGKLRIEMEDETVQSFDLKEVRFT